MTHESDSTDQELRIIINTAFSLVPESKWHALQALFETGNIEGAHELVKAHAPDYEQILADALQEIDSAPDSPGDH
jgi:hypothetical protein